MPTSEIGQIVWHDLITPDATAARQFYGDLLGWHYRVEHAEDFAWGGGEADYPLIVADGEAHGGIVELRSDVAAQWLAWVAVQEVDATTDRAKRLGATILREPFDVPGVGRGSMIRDPGGAVICPYTRTHNFPPPRGTFVRDELLTPDLEAATRFYTELFAWQTSALDSKENASRVLFTTPDGVEVARARASAAGEAAMWLVYLATADVDAGVTAAIRLGARTQPSAMDVSGVERSSVLRDPAGAGFGLLTHRP